MKSLHFCGEKLISLDSKNEIAIFSLATDTHRMLTSYCLPNTVTALVADPSLDYLLLGLQSGKEKIPGYKAKKTADATG